MSAAIRLKGAPNFRDFGGCVTADGRRVRRGKLFRSEALHQLTADDHALLSGLGIRLVCDLRSDLERSRKPTTWPAPQLPTLLLLGVPREHVRADYLKSGQHHGAAQLEADLALQLEAVLGQAPAPEMIRVIAGVREAYLDSTIAALTARHGSVESYFAGAGIDRDQIREFRARLIE